MNWADAHAVYVAPAYALTALVFAVLAARAFFALRAAARAAKREEGG